MRPSSSTFPSALNFYARAALIAADPCLTPFDCGDFFRRALYALMETANGIREDAPPSLAVESIIVNQFQPRAILPQRLMEERRQDGLPVLAARLSASVKVRKSP
jgi:chromosome partitioning protein